MDNVAGHIGELEERIDTLRASLERCRKISLAAKITIGVGAAWFALFLIWIVPFGPTSFVGSVAAMLGGCVLLGSNATTWAETDQALAAAQRARDDLIGQIDLHLVGDAPATPRTIH
jgi:hypothetical protein